MSLQETNFSLSYTGNWLKYIGHCKNWLDGACVSGGVAIYVYAEYSSEQSQIKKK